MGFEFAWDNDDKIALRYTASGDWNWKDYHLSVRQSLFTLHKHEESVDSIIDIRQGTRDELPRGLASHVRTFGKPFQPNLSGRAVAIGFPQSALDELNLDEDNILQTPYGMVRFVDTDEEAYSTMQQWREEVTSGD